MKSNQNPDERIHVRKRVAGGTTGAVLGAVIAGPVGALVGTVVGRAAERGALPQANPPNSASVGKPNNRSKEVVRKAAGQAGTKAKTAATSQKKTGSRAKITPARTSRKS